MIRVNCPGCGWLLKVPDNHTGKQDKCPGCGRRLEEERSFATTNAAGDVVSDLVDPNVTTGDTNTDFDKMLDDVLFQSTPTIPSTDPTNAEFLPSPHAELGEVCHVRSEWESLVDSGIHKGSVSRELAADSSHTANNRSTMGNSSLSGRLPGFLQTSEGFGFGISVVIFVASVVLSKILPVGHDATRYTFDAVEVFEIRSNKPFWPAFCVLGALVICLLFSLHNMFFCRRSSKSANDAQLGVIAVFVFLAIYLCVYLLKPSTTIDRVSVAQDTVTFTSRASTRTVARDDIRDVQIFRDKFRRTTGKGSYTHLYVSYSAAFALADGTELNSTAISTRLSGEQVYREYFEALRARLTD